MNKNMFAWGLFLLLAISIGPNYSCARQAADKSKEPKASIKLDVYKIEEVGDKKLVQIKLKRIKDNAPVNLTNLKEVHTEKIHLLIIDDALEDYSHIHPRALKETGSYEFEWRPKKQGNYRIWADLFPFDTNMQEYVIANLTTGQKSKPDINRNVVMESTVSGYNFKLSFDNSNLVVGNSAMGTIVITDSKGNPVKNLEPIMDAFAHIVGFSDDLKTVVHIHPMGVEPSKPTDRGGPELQFHIEFEKAGFVKLFAQVRIGGQELFAPFSINVEK